MRDLQMLCPAELSIQIYICGGSRSPTSPPRYSKQGCVVVQHTSLLCVAVGFMFFMYRVGVGIMCAKPRLLCAMQHPAYLTRGHPSACQRGFCCIGSGCPPSLMMTAWLPGDSGAPPEQRGTGSQWTTSVWLYMRVCLCRQADVCVWSGRLRGRGRDHPKHSPSLWAGQQTPQNT